MGKKLIFNKKKREEVETFLKNRFIYLKGLRQDLDTAILEEIDIYNDHDKNMQPWDEATKTGVKWWEENKTIPYIYTIVQTMVARLIQSFFGRQNYLKIYVEDNNYKDIERSIKKWLQYELDRIKLKSRGRDFLEDSLVQRTTWLYLRPIMKSGKMTKVDFNVYEWFDVYFDTRVREVKDTDMFLRNIIPYWKLKENSKEYFNIEDVSTTIPPDEEIQHRQVYEVKQSKDKSVSYYGQEGMDSTEEVEVMYYLGWYNVSKKENEVDYKPVVFHWANQTQLIRAELIDYETERKKYIFPIRPIRQANSLVGKSVAQIVGSLQYLLNEVVSYTIHNYKLLVKLLFKYNKNGNVDLDELWAGAGNAIGWEDNKDDVDIFQIPNMVQVGLLVVSWIIQFMQQATGAVDYLMGTSAARGTTETASGIQTITQQAMFKFQMMAENVYSDLIDMVQYLMIMWIKYNPQHILDNFPELDGFIKQTDQQLEDSRIIDIGLNDLTLRRDQERTSFLNGINIIAGLVEKVQGNIPELLKQVMDRLEMENIEQIMEGAKSPAQLMEMQGIMQQAMEAAAQANQQKGGSQKANPQADNAATPEEEESNTTPGTAEGGI